MSTFKETIINLYGDRGKTWLRELPELVESVAIQYGLSELTPVNNLSYNYVLFGLRGERPIVLKLSLDIPGLKREALALSSFANFGAVNVFAEDDGILILERALPGYALKSYFPVRDNEAIDIACHVIKQLHQAPQLETSIFPHVKDWLMILDKDWDIPVHTLQKTRQLRDGLLANSAKSILLHGDLHHDNILQNDHHWCVIDPKGVLGEPAYEVAAFIRNPMPELLGLDNVVNIINNRIARFSMALELPESKILDWCFVQAVLAWAWALEDGCDVVYFKRLTEIFDR